MRTERMHLPIDSTGILLELQSPRAVAAGKRRNPPEGVYKNWLGKQVERRRGRAAAG